MPRGRSIETSSPESHKSVVHRRPPAVAYERFVYALTGMEGRGDPMGSLSPILSQINTNWDDPESDADAQTGERSFERTRRFLHNVMGDVVAVIEDTPLTNPNVRIRYSAFGLPTAVPFFSTADFDDGSGNGVPDGGITIEDLFHYMGLFNAGNPIADLDGGDYTLIPDGGVTVSDLLAFLTLNSGGKVSTLDGVRFAYRGYQYDPHLNLYHVRHRVLDPELGRWLQRDPAGFVDGLNLYAYTRSSPFGSWDPYGLDDVTWGDYFYAHFINLWTPFSGPVYVDLPPGVTQAPGRVTNPPSSNGYDDLDRMLDNNNGSPTLGNFHRSQTGVNVAQGLHNVSSGLLTAAEIAEFTLRLLNDPVDWVITIGEISDNPTDYAAYATVIPIVGDVVRAGKKVRDIEKVGSKYIAHFVDGTSKEISKSKAKKILKEIADKAGKECHVPKPGIGGKGWRGESRWKDAVKDVTKGGDFDTKTHGTPTLQEARDLIEESGGKVIREESGHAPGGVSHHTYPHINYTTPDGAKGTIEITGPLQ